MIIVSFYCCILLYYYCILLYNYCILLNNYCILLLLYPTIFLLYPSIEILRAPGPFNKINVMSLIEFKDQVPYLVNVACKDYGK